MPSESRDRSVAPPRWPGGRLYLVASFYGSGPVTELAMEGPGGEGTPGFLFGLPEYGAAFKTVLNNATDELTREKSQVLRNIRSEAAQRVRATHITAPSGEIVSNPPIAVALPYHFILRDVTEFDLRTFAERCDQVAETLTDVKLDALLDYSGRISEAIGNIGSAGGQPFGWPVVLLALEKVQIDFSPAGEPMLPMIVAENDRRDIVPYPPMSDSDKQAFDELMERKRKEFNARRGTSQLR